MGKSFYGGMDGRPFIIKKSFESVPEMTEAFRQGHKYTEVNYGEYVLINNEDRNHPDNGKIYRRAADLDTNKTVEYWEFEGTSHQYKPKDRSAYGAVYIGTIVGPDGSAPKFQLLGNRTPGDVQLDHFQDGTWVETSHVLIPDNADESDGEINLFAGSPNKEDNKMTFTAYSFRDNNGNSSTVYLDMSMPYNVIEWEKEQLESQKQVEMTTLTNIPFYQKYRLGIPKGQDGTSFNNIRVITPTSEHDVVTISFDENRNIIATKYEGLQDDIDNQRKIWVADIIDYKVTDEGTKYLVYLGDYNVINGASIENGYLDITTSHKENEIHKQLHWPIKVDINTETGAITYTDVEMKDGANITYSQNPLRWVKDINISDTGYLDIDTTTKENETHKQLHWVKNVSIDDESGKVTYTDIDSTETQEQLTWVRDVDFNEDGTVTVKYTTNKADTVYSNLIEYPKEVYISPMGEVSAVTNTGKTLSEYQDILRWMTSAELSQDGTFTRIDNRGKKTEQEGALKWVEGVSLAQNGTLTKHFNNIDFPDEVQSEKLIWPVNIHINSEDGKVITTYNNGEENSSQNPQLDWIKEATLSNDKQLQIDFINTDSISVDLKTPNKIELTRSGDFLVYYNSDPDTAVHLGNIGELGSISACAAKAEEDVPGELKVGGLWFVIQEESEEEVE